MPGAVSWREILQKYGRGRSGSQPGEDSGIVERSRRRYWLLNLVVFVCISVPTLLLPTASWPLRAAAAAGLIGACVWEGVGLRLRRFPVWADVLETIAVGVVAWRYPAGNGGLVIVLAFALLGLGFRTLYSMPGQAVVRTVVVIAAIYAGLAQHPAGLSRREPVVVLVGVLALSGILTSRLVAQRAVARTSTPQ
jgi:hypothetical protein